MHDHDMVSSGCKARLQEYEGILEIRHKREVSHLKNVPLKPQVHTGMVATETQVNELLVQFAAEKALLL